MRRIELGGGAVAFELEGQADNVGSLDPKELLQRGWKPEVVENYVRYNNKFSLPNLDLSQGSSNSMVSAASLVSAAGAAPVGSVASAGSLVSAPRAAPVGSVASASSIASAAKNHT